MTDTKASEFQRARACLLAAEGAIQGHEFEFTGKPSTKAKRSAHYKS